jgi:hypothetical protein
VRIVNNCQHFDLVRNDLGMPVGGTCTSITTRPSKVRYIGMIVDMASEITSRSPNKTINYNDISGMGFSKRMALLAVRTS